MTNKEFKEKFNRDNLLKTGVDIDVVVDVQKDFITGALANAEAAKRVGRIASTIEEHCKHGGLLYLTMDTHYQNYLDTLEGRNLPVEHCIKYSQGWNIAPEVNDVLCRVNSNQFEFIKKSAFGSTTLASAIVSKLESFGLQGHEIKNNINKIRVYGFCTDICVISNAMILRSEFPNVEIEVLSDCCAGTTKESHDIALLAMKQCMIEIS